jgi:hypothetical protein
MPRFAPAGAKKDRAERLAREAKEAKKRTMASQQSRRYQTAQSYQDEGTNTLSTTPMIFGRVMIPTILLCILLLVVCVLTLFLRVLVFLLKSFARFCYVLCCMFRYFAVTPIMFITKLGKTCHWPDTFLLFLLSF